MKRLGLLFVALYATSALAAETTRHHHHHHRAVECIVDYSAGQSSFVAPVAANSLVATCSVSQPSTLVLTGPDASFFVLSGTSLNVGASAITQPRIYNVTITATP